jgi:hypothetical protein
MSEDADLKNARETLANWFTDLDINTRLLQKILTSHPDLSADAAQWSWSDTEVRGDLASHLSQELLGRPWPTYNEQDTQDFLEELKDAHAQWIARADGETR